MNRIRKLSTEILEKYEERFGENFEDNKRALLEVSVITSKELKNKVAGFITKTKKRATRERLKKEADQRAREEAAAAEEAEVLEQAEETQNMEAAKPEVDGGVVDIRAEEMKSSAETGPEPTPNNTKS